MEDSGHLGADNDDAMMVEEDSGPVEDAGEWPVFKVRRIFSRALASTLF